MLVIAISLSIPAVQTKLGQYATQKINEDYKSDITVGRVSVSLFGSVNLHDILIRDYKKNTLVSAKNIRTDILSFKKLFQGQLQFGTIRAANLLLNMKIYKGEKTSNLDRFILLFETEKKPDEPPFLLSAKTIQVKNSRFLYTDENAKHPVFLNLKKIQSTLKNFKINGPNVAAKINELNFLDHRGLYVQNISADFSYTKSQLVLNKLFVKTQGSNLAGDLKLTYRLEDFADFNNKVQINLQVNSSLFAGQEIALFYNEIGKNQVYKMNGRFKGTLNHLSASSLLLTDNMDSKIQGEVTFLNLLGKAGQDVSVYGDFTEISSNYEALKNTLPNILGKNLPQNFQKLGKFYLQGEVGVSPEALSANFTAATGIGHVRADISINSLTDINRASYKGNVVLNQFNLGALLGRNDVGTVTCNLDVKGNSFNYNTLQAAIKGDVQKFHFNGYTYQNIVIDGAVNKPVFKGTLFVNDPNLFMDFDGSITLSKKDIRYDFETKIDYADFVKLKINTTDSISVFKGAIKAQIQGTSLDDMRGDVFMSEMAYQNNKDNYLFDDFQLTSSFDEQKIRTITINSPDIIKGKIVGRFEFGQLQKMIENSLGSLYTNYSPNKIKSGQFLKFDFALYSKIVEIFFPDITISPNTKINGTINSDTDDFKLQFNSPQVGAYDNYFDRISIRLDNKNPLYSAYVEMDSIRTKLYKISDFSLINVTTNDTLFVHSEFNGGSKGKDKFNLNLYHTIDEERNNIVGFDKSDLKIKDYLWHLNEQKKSDNKIIFDNNLKNFKIDNVMLSRENQAMVLNGLLDGLNRKDLQLTFKEVDVDALTPAIEDFKVTGKLNGAINLKQDNDIFQPTSSLLINNLIVNNKILGALNIDITGNESLRSFQVNSSLINNNVESFNAAGKLSIVEQDTYSDIDLRFNRLNLSIFEALGQNVLTNINGFASGTARIEGLITNPEINGRLFLDETSVTVPYLNVNYQLEDRSVIDVTERAFIIRNAQILDKKFQTKGFIDGRIRHNRFADWTIDLDVYSDKMLALDTQDSEDAIYYGIAFINGSAKISGPTDGLFVKVDAKSEKGTSIKIPISDAVATGTSGFIHLVTPDEKNNKKQATTKKLKDYTGLEMEFNFDITPDAEVEVILDRNTGHAMKGRGFGSLLFKINTLGKFNMWGDFQAYEGIYNFKYGGLIDKKFEVKKGGSIVWEGDPMRAVLNLEAVYKTTANPAILLENASFNRKVPTEVVIGIRGNLTNPDPDFDIRFPTVSSILESEIQYKLADDDTRQTQALYLLSSGGFLSPEGVSQSDLTGNLFERASGIFNDLFQDEDGKFVVGVDYVSPDRRLGIETDGRFGVSVSTQINDRISINGKVGVPVGGINESTIVGNVEIQYRVNDDGSLNVKMFNRENDINYIGQGIGYTQGIGLNYEVNFDTFKEFANKVFTNIKIDKEVFKNKSGQEFLQDSGLPEYININSEPKPLNDTPKPNTEAIPHED